MAPKSLPLFPEGLLEAIFNDISDHEILTPITRDLIGGKFDRNSVTKDISTRLSHADLSETSTQCM